MINTILNTIQIVLKIIDKVTNTFDEKKKKHLLDLKKELLEEINKPNDFSENARDDNKVVYLLERINILLGE